MGRETGRERKYAATIRQHNMTGSGIAGAGKKKVNWNRGRWCLTLFGGFLDTFSSEVPPPDTEVAGDFTGREAPLVLDHSIRTSKA